MSDFEEQPPQDSDSKANSTPPPLRLWYVPMDKLQQYCGLTKVSTDPLLLSAQFDWLLEPYSRLEFSLGYNRGVWRARFCTPIGFPNFEDMSHPPSDVAPANRLNEKGEPILYCSLNNRTALQEIEAKTGDYVQLVNYRVDPTLKLRCCVFGELLRVHRAGRSWVDDQLEKSLNHILNRVPPDAGTSILYLDGFMSEILHDPDAAATGYLRSRILASRLFAKYPDVDAVLYPSVAVEGGKNLAIRPSAAQKVLTVASSAVLRIVKSYEYGLFDFEVAWYDFPPWIGTAFHWKRPPASSKWEPEKFLAMETELRAKQR